MKQMLTLSRAVGVLSILCALLFFTLAKCPSPIDHDPRIWVNLSEFSITAYEGGANPSSQTLQVRNSGVQTLNYTISYEPDWLIVFPTSGTSSTNINVHTVSVDIGGLIEGEYYGTITITEDNAVNSPKIVNVILEILKPNIISLSCNPSSGGAGSTVTIAISIIGNTQEISAFGLELTYDSSLFEYQSVSAGNLTGSWSVVDGNEIIPGTARIGGFTGASGMISQWSMGSIAVVNLKVTGSGWSSGQQSQICIQNCIDDIVGMIPYPSCITFTFMN